MIIKMNIPLMAYFKFNFAFYDTNSIVFLRKENKGIVFIFDKQILIDTFVLDNNDNIIESHGGNSIIKLFKNNDIVGTKEIIGYAVSLKEQEGYSMSIITENKITNVLF
jgi:hypothetical protein